MTKHETLIAKLNERITKLTIVKDILRTAPKLNINAKIVIKEITNIDLEDLEKELNNK